MANFVDKKLWVVATRFLFTSILLGPRPFLTVAVSCVHDLGCLLLIIFSLFVELPTCVVGHESPAGRLLPQQ